MYRRGFTIIELIIVITVMGILLVLGVVNLNGSQSSARDAERKADIETIAAHLETYYIAGSDTDITVGHYPFASNTAPTGLIGNETTYLRDIDPKSLQAPNMDTSSLVAASNNLAQSPTINQYIYQPIASDGSLCDTLTKECRKFNLYYKLETATTNCPTTICVVTSKNQ